MMTEVAGEAGHRPRERALEEGVGALGDGDLLAILLGTGLSGRPVTLVAAGLLESAGGVTALARLGPKAIAEHPGVGPAKALRIAAALELGQRVARRAAIPLGEVRSSAAVAAFAASFLGGLAHEEAWILGLDGRNHLIGRRRVAQGGIHACAMLPRDVLRAAIHDGAAAIVLVHNHPSGDPTPSPEDDELTRRLAAAAMIVGTPLVDHVVVAPSGSYASYLDLGRLGGG